MLEPAVTVADFARDKYNRLVGDGVLPDGREQNWGQRTIPDACICCEPRKCTLTPFSSALHFSVSRQKGVCGSDLD